MNNEIDNKKKIIDGIKKIHRKLQFSPGSIKEKNLLSKKYEKIQEKIETQSDIVAIAVNFFWEAFEKALSDCEEEGNLDSLDKFLESSYGKIRSNQKKMSESITSPEPKDYPTSHEKIQGLEKRIAELEEENTALRRLVEETSTRAMQFEAQLQDQDKSDNKEAEMEKPKIPFPTKDDIPESYRDRADRREKAIDFYRRVYGKWLEAGHIIYQDQLGGKNGFDPPLLEGIRNQLKRNSAEITKVIPPKGERIKLEVESIDKLDKKEFGRQAANAYRLA